MRFLYESVLPTQESNNPLNSWEKLKTASELSRGGSSPNPMKTFKSCRIWAKKPDSAAFMLKVAESMKKRMQFKKN
jgi:hypothetical protein